MDAKQKDEKVAQMPNMPTHTVIPGEIMGELLQALGTKLTWVEANPIMMKFQENATPVVINEDGTGFQILTQPPKA